MSEPTKEQRCWWKRFGKCLKEMPPNMEVHVYAHGNIAAAVRGAASQHFKERGDIDNTPTLSLPDIRVPGVVNNGCSL